MRGIPYSPEKKSEKEAHPDPNAERVQKIISNAGFCSRRKAEEFIAEGKVTVNGKIIKLGDKALHSDDIKIGNASLNRSGERKIYMMLNKPIGYVSTLADPFEKKTIAGLIPVSERVYPIGRLDKDAHGLMILTNDGDFANLLMHPRYEIKKTYQVRLDKPYDTSFTEKMRRGILLRDGIVKADVRKMEKHTVLATLHEGRKYIVKRMFMKCGYNVTDLVRIAIGPITLDIKAGKTRSLTKEEVTALRKSAKIPVKTS